MRFFTLFLVLALALVAFGKFDIQAKWAKRAPCTDEDNEEAAECVTDALDDGPCADDLEDCDCLGDLIKCAPDCTVEDADEVECDADDEADCEEVYGEGCKHCKCGDASTMYVSIGAVMAAVAVALF